MIPFYTEKELKERLARDEVSYPFSDKDATYDSEFHQYELTEAYFLERDVNIREGLGTTGTEDVKKFLRYLRTKVYVRIYTHCKSTRAQLNYMIARRGLRGYTPYEYRQAFLEAMFLEGVYLLDNGDISAVTGVDLDTMQNMSADVIRGQDRDFHKDVIKLLATLGLEFRGRYSFRPQGEDW